MATRTLSAAVSEPKSSRRWNVRARPRRARRFGPLRAMSWPFMKMSPWSGRCSPVMTLNNVVFPAPLGPISPVTSPADAVSETPESAVTPPKRTATARTSSAAASAGMGHVLTGEEFGWVIALVGEGQAEVGHQPIEAENAVGALPQQRDPRTGPEPG